MLRPIVKWAGGKARLAASICDAFQEPCTGTYYEPFVGSGAVFLHRRARKRVGRAVLADLNGKLVEAHRAIQADVDAVLAALAALPVEDWRERYYDVRDAYNAGPWEGAAHAARFLWLNRAGFNGLYRENRRGHFNVPVGRYDRLAFPSAAAFKKVARAYRDVEFRVADFRELLEQAGEGDQVYCDPPYVPLTQTARFTAYCKEPFGEVEQVALRDHACDAARRGARVVLSNHDTPEVRGTLYAEALGFEHVARPRVVRAISRSAEGRSQQIAEVIAAIGPLPEAA